MDYRGNGMSQGIRAVASKVQQPPGFSISLSLSCLPKEQGSVVGSLGK